MATTRASGYVVTHTVWNDVLSRLTDDGVTFSGNFNGGSVAGTTGTFSSTLGVTGTLTGTTISASTAFSGAANLTITGSGPHALGAATAAGAFLRLGGTFAGSGATIQRVLGVESSLTGVTDQIGAGIYVNPSITPAGSPGVGAGVYIDAVAVGTGSGPAFTNGAGLYIAGATTNATNNYALYVAAGTSYFGGAVQLRGATGDGTWATESFNAAHYTANGSMTWTVGSGDVATNRYTRINDTIIWTLRVATTTVGGTPNTQLRVTLPGGFTAASGASVWAAYCQDNGTLRDALVSIESGNTYAAITRQDGSNWTASTDLTYVYFQIAFEI